MIKSVNLLAALIVIFLMAACANSEKKVDNAATTAALEAAAVSLANDMCSAKQAVATSGDDAAKLAEYEKKSAELNQRLADLEDEYSSEEQRKKLNQLIAEMTANCVTRKDTLQ